MATTKEPFGWYPDAEGVKQYNNDVGGDYQVTEIWSVRLINDQNQSIIDINGYGEGFGWNYDTEKFDGDYGVTVQIEYMECADREDPGGTEITCDYEYDNDKDPLAYTKEDVESGALLAACKDAVESYARTAGRDFYWDGHDAMSRNRVDGNQPEQEA